MLHIELQYSTIPFFHIFDLKQAISTVENIVFFKI